MLDFDLIDIGWSFYNGFHLDILFISCKKFEGSLFGINFGGTFLYIDILFFNFKIYDKTD